MALKPLRKYDEGTDISYVMRALPTGVTRLERGVVVIQDSNYTPSGKVGDGNNVAVVPTGTNGKPLGVLATDVVDIDLSMYPHVRSFYRDEVPLCSPVNIVTHGYVYTNAVASGVTPAFGQAAHFTTDGLFTTTTTSVRVGTFRGGLDTEGYVGVDVHPAGYSV